MTVAELIAKLQQLPQDMHVTMKDSWVPVLMKNDNNKELVILNKPNADQCDSFYWSKVL